MLEERPDRDLPINRWWQRPKYIAALAALVFALSFSAFAYRTWTTALDVGETKENISEYEPIIARLDNLAEDNAKNIASLEKNQVGIDTLVDFVNDLRRERVQNEQPPSSGDPYIRLLCASSDPIRQAACAEIQGE